MNFEFVSTWWFKVAVSFIFLTIYTVIVLKAEEKRREKDEREV